MLIAERVLIYGTKGSGAKIRLKIFAPIQDESSWICRYEIDWPHGIRSSYGAGLDAVQALYLTLQKIGVDIYMSEYHASGCLFWGEKGAGYGFPVPKNGRNFLIGDDLKFEG